MQPARRGGELASAVVRTVIGTVGRVLVTVGLLILLFAVYQLWGTGINEARAQSDLRSTFEHDLAAGNPTTTGAATTTSSPTPTTAAPDAAPVAPPEGEPVGEITIDKIGVDKIVVEGTTVPDLRKGPGHYAGSPLPGQLGNSAIAGHRTTYGAPFGDLDQLARGDLVTIRTVTGTWDYRLTQDPFAVEPGRTDVLNSVPGQATLTLTTCNPKYSASERLVVKAQLAEPPLLAPAPQPELVVDTGLSGGGESRTPAIISCLVAALVGGLWWLFFHRYPRWTTWLAGVIPFLAALFVFYTFLERVLPNNY